MYCDENELPQLKSKKSVDTKLSKRLFCVWHFKDDVLNDFMTFLLNIQWMYKCLYATCVRVCVTFLENSFFFLEINGKFL